MFKKYFFLAVGIVLINLFLTFFSWFDFLPFNNIIVLGGVFLTGILLALFYPQEIFYWFVASLALENVFLIGKNFPISLRLYQFLAVALFLGMFLRRLFLKKEDFSNFFSRNFFGKINLVKNQLKLVIFSFLLFFPLGGWLMAFNKENIQWALIIASFVFVFWLTSIFLKSEKERALGIIFFILGGAVVWLAGFYQALAMRLGWKSFVVMDGRINSVFLEPDWLGVYAVFYLGLLLGIKIFIFQWKNGKKLFLGKWRLVGFLDQLLNWKVFLWMLLIVLTVSRSAWLASLAVIFAYIFWIIFRQKRFLFGIREGIIMVLIFLGAFVVIKISGLSNFNLLNRANSTLNGQQKITISCRNEQVLPEKINQMEDLAILGCRHINLEEIDVEKKAGFFVSEINRPDPNVSLRYEIYKKTWRSIQARFWLGQGWGASARILGRDEQNNGLNTSNIFLEVWLASGFLGLGVFLLVIFLVMKNIFSWPLSWQGLGVFPLVGFFVANLFNAGIFLGFFWFFLAGVNFNLKKE